MGKIKTEKVDASEEVDTSVVVKEEDSYEDKVRNASAIAQPMASKKLTKKVHKLIEKGRTGSGLQQFVVARSNAILCFVFVASKQKNFLRNGLKDVQIRLRKGETG